MDKHAKKRSAKKKTLKTKLGVPDLDYSKAAVLESLRLPESKRGFRHATDEFIQWYCSEPQLSFNKVVVTASGIALESRGPGQSPVDRSRGELAAGVRRVKGVKKLGVRLGN